MPISSMSQRMVHGRASSRMVRACWSACTSNSFATCITSAPRSAGACCGALAPAFRRARSSSCSDRRVLRSATASSLASATSFSAAVGARSAIWACACSAESGVRSSCAASPMKRRSPSTASSSCRSAWLNDATSGCSSRGSGAEESGVRSKLRRWRICSPSASTGLSERRTTNHISAPTSSSNSVLMTSAVIASSRSSASTTLWRLPTCTYTRPILSETEYTRHRWPAMTVVATPSAKSGRSGASGAPGERTTSRLPSSQTWKASASLSDSASSRSCRPLPGGRSKRSLFSAGMVSRMRVAMVWSLSSQMLFLLCVR